MSKISNTQGDHTFITTKIENRPLGTDEPIHMSLIVGDYGGQTKGKAHALDKSDDVDGILSSFAPTIEVTFDRTPLCEGLSEQGRCGESKTSVCFRHRDDFTRKGLQQQLEQKDEVVRDTQQLIRQLQRLQTIMKVPRLRQQLDLFLFQNGPSFGSLAEFVEVFLLQMKAGRQPVGFEALLKQLEEPMFGADEG